MSKNLNKAIWEVLRKRMESLSWKCGECEKILECEEHATTDGKLLSDEPRYCQRLIEAAVFEEVNFLKPFPIDKELNKEQALPDKTG